MFAHTDLIGHPLRFQAHPEVWLLVAFLASAYIYVVRVLGPGVVGPGRPAVSRTNLICFAGAITVLWAASDWPVHDIGEGYLYSVHMIQHMALSYFLPPLALLATPTWLGRVLLGDGAVYRFTKRMAHPVVAGLLFNGVVMLIHIPGMVNASIENGPLHYLLHVLVVSASLLMWMPVCGPIPEFRIGYMGQMIYLFLQSVVPTIPAAWLTFADGVVYKVYDRPVRLWGITVVEDQQMAGAFMKVGGGFFLWAIVIFLFFKRFAAGHGASEYDFRRGASMPDAEIVGHDDRPLTTADVEQAFAESAPARIEPRR
jgi:putative membrane protein